jgi:hypothetical protein
MPGGLLVIVPFPVKLTATGTRERRPPAIAAVTDRARDIDTTHAPLPEQAPPQTTGFALGVRVTATPAPYDPTHASPQTIPGTSLVTEPPTAATASEYTVSGGANVAVTERGLLMITVHCPVPEHAPPQPANVQPGVGVADSATLLSVAKEREHVGPQSMPPGVLVTRP